MTYHVVYNHTCAHCGAFYIPYDRVPCPRCGQEEAERFDYIPQATMSLLINKRTYGDYTPGAWWVGSLGDHILSLLFRILDAYAEEKKALPFEPWLDKALTKINWGEQTYLKSHVRGIALRVREELDREEAEARHRPPPRPRAMIEAEMQAAEEKRQREKEERARSPWGDTLCASCGKRLSTWADNGLKRCGYCRHPLPER